MRRVKQDATITVRIPSSLKRTLEVMARDQRCSLSDLVWSALQDYADKENEL